jgi:hypothetical protein
MPFACYARECDCGRPPLCISCCQLLRPGCGSYGQQGNGSGEVAAAGVAAAVAPAAVVIAAAVGKVAVAGAAMAAAAWC